MLSYRIPHYPWIVWGLIMVRVLPSGWKSFYAEPPPLFLNENAGFETNSRPYVLKYDAPCHPDVDIPYLFEQTRKYSPKYEAIFSIASFLVSSSHETYHWFWGGSYRRRRISPKHGTIARDHELTVYGPFCVWNHSSHTWFLVCVLISRLQNI